MEHRDLETLRTIAEIRPVAAPMTRCEKLERWADIIESQGPQRFRTFYQVEYAPAAERAAARQDGSPFALAYADPDFREAGLTGDTYGEAMSFFELSEREAHRLFCSCMHGGIVGSDHLASELRRMASPTGGGFISRIAAGLGR